MMEEIETSPPPQFRPFAYYGRGEDAITIYFEPDESYAKRLNETITLFLSLGTDELVGCQVKGVLSKLKRGGFFKISISHKRMNVGLFFHMLAWEIEETNERNRVVEIGQKARDIELESADLCVS